MFLSVMTKNLNWEILTKTLLLKDGMGIRMKNFGKYYWDSPKNTIF